MFGWSGKKDAVILSPDEPDAACKALEQAVKEELAVQKVDISDLDLILDNEIYIRFLRARQFNLQNSKIMLVNTIKWRLQTVPSQIEAADILDILKLDYLFFHELDKEENPIVWVSVQNHVNYSGKDKQYESLVLWMMEYGMKKWRAGQIKSSRATLVFDMTNFGMPNMDYHLVKFLADKLQANYPEVLAHVYVVDSPWIFQACWKLIKGWLDPVTAGKIVFVSKRDLENHIDKEIIPVLCGGQCEHKKQWEVV